MKQILSNKLKSGDTIAIISPSAPLAGLLPHRLQKGINALKNIGMKVKLSKNALKIDNYVSANPKQRAGDINKAFADSSINAIMASIGGNHSNQILDYLDYETIKKNPKPVIGYSDITVLQTAIYAKTGLVTFYGPCLLTQFAENPKPYGYTLKYFRKALFQNYPIGVIESSRLWTEEILDWFQKDDLKRPRKTKRNKGWTWLKKGNGKGKLLGGCIVSLMHLRGTEYWPNFDNSLLFWEIPEGKSIYEGEDPANVDSYLTDLKLSGVFNKIKGMIIGRPYHYSKEKQDLIKQIIIKNTEAYKFPILFGVDIGHTDPMITLPIGITAKLDSSTNTFKIIGSGVK